MGFTRNPKFRGLVSIKTLKWKPRRDPNNYSPEQRLMFRRYVRFKARARISCSYWEWLSKYKDSYLESICDTRNWWKAGRCIAETEVQMWEENFKKKNK